MFLVGLGVVLVIRGLFLGFLGTISVFYGSGLVVEMVVFLGF